MLVVGHNPTPSKWRLVKTYHEYPHYEKEYRCRRTCWQSCAPGKKLKFRQLTEEIRYASNIVFSASLAYDHLTTGSSASFWFYDITTQDIPDEEELAITQLFRFSPSSYHELMQNVFSGKIKLENNRLAPTLYTFKGGTKHDLSIRFYDQEAEGTPVPLRPIPEDEPR